MLQFTILTQTQQCTHVRDRKIRLGLSYTIHLCGQGQRRWTFGTSLSFPPTKVRNLLLHWLGWDMLSGSTKLEWSYSPCSLCLYSSLVDPVYMSRPSKWSSRFLTFARGKEREVPNVQRRCAQASNFKAALIPEPEIRNRIWCLVFQFAKLRLNCRI